MGAFLWVEKMPEVENVTQPTGAGSVYVGNSADPRNQIAAAIAAAANAVIAAASVAADQALVAGDKVTVEGLTAIVEAIYGQIVTGFKTQVSGYKTYADLVAALALLDINGDPVIKSDTLHRITNDPDPLKNWLYQWDGVTLTKSSRDDLAALSIEVANRSALIKNLGTDFDFVGSDDFLQGRIGEGLLYIQNLFTAKNEGGDSFDLIGSDYFRFARVSPTMSEFAGLKVIDDGSGGLRVVGSDHFVIVDFNDLTPQPEPVPEVISVTQPLFNSPLVTFSGQPVFVDVASLVGQRSLVNRTRNLLATISDQSGKGFEQSRETLRFLSSEYSSGGFLTLCDTANNTNTICRVPLVLRTAPVGLTGQANKNVLMIGDSITNRGIASLTKSYLSGYGYNTTFVGTLKTALDSQSSTQTGGEYAEAREGHETGDYTYRYTDRVQIVSVGGEETYLSLGLTDKTAAREFNPFLRAATGDDSPSIVRNGYVFDCAFYQSRFAATSQPVPTPDVVLIMLGTNNSRDRDGSALATEYAEDMAQMINSAKAAWPSAKIIVGMHNTSSTLDRETAWETEYAPMLRALINLRNTISGLIVAPIHALTPSEIGFSITTGSATTDSVTGALIGGLADDIHPQLSGRYNLAHVLASYTAAAIQNLI